MSPSICKTTLFAATAAMIALFPCAAFAKTKVEAGKPKFDDLQSPMMSGGKQKSFTPKDWLEVETEIQVSMDPAPKNKTCDRLTVKWYVAVDNPEKPGIYLKFTKDIEHVNIPLGEKVWCSVYLSPSSIRRLTGSDKAGKGAVKAVGYEILVDGAVVASDSSNGGKWWADPKAAAKFADSTVVPLLSKAETPFAQSWWDRYAEEKSIAAGAR